jgi:RND family efflux transporter MFP subunit
MNILSFGSSMPKPRPYVGVDAARQGTYTCIGYLAWTIGMTTRLFLVVAALAVLASVPGCRRDAAREAAAPVPAVRVLEVRSEEGAGRRTLAGVLLVAEETTLSFPVGGRLLDVMLREGEDFAPGQVIARLDPADLERDLAARRAQLAAAEGRLREGEESFRRQETLSRSGTVSRAALDRAAASLSAARAEQRVAEVAVATAEANLRRSELRAPRAGVVVRVQARQFEEVAPGQPVYEVGSRDALEVEVLVPEQLVPGLAYGAPVAVTVPGLDDRLVTGRVIEIGSAADAGNAFRVRARLDEVPPGARSGMSARVALTLPGAGDGATVFAVPLSALAFETTETGPVVGRKAALFVLDPARGTVRRVEVPVRGMAGNRVFVTGGLADGDRVVTAGVAFLRDGQRARAWVPPG